MHEIGAAPTERKGLGNAREVDGVNPLAFPVYKAAEQHAIAFYRGRFFDCDEVACYGDVASDELRQRP